MPNLRIRLFVASILGLAVSGAAAQDAAQLQKLYDDTLVQLQQSQDRKNELANENAKLVERIAQLEKEVRALRSAADRAELMAMQYSAFRTFLNRYPALLANFSQYGGTEPTPERTLPQTSFELFDRNWPFSALAVSEGA
jgi:hypothetical protein